MIYALMFILLFAIGGLTGIFLGTLNTDVHLHDIYFVVAHFHYVMMGSALIAFFGALHYRWPKMSGRMYAERPAMIMAVIVFFAFDMTFIPQFIMGSRGMPRRYFDYDPRFELMHKLSSKHSSGQGSQSGRHAGLGFRPRRAPWLPRHAAWLEEVGSPP